MSGPAARPDRGAAAPSGDPAEVVVVGAGGHAAEVCAYVLAIADACGGPTLLGCLDDHRSTGTRDHVTVLGPLDSLPSLGAAATRTLGAITATGDNVLRRQFVDRIDRLGLPHLRWWTLVHPTALVGPAVVLGEGTCLAPGSIVTARVRIGRHSIVNVNASISHDATVGDFVNINPGVIVAGEVRIGDGCYIGAGATIIDHVSVGAGTTIGAGAVVIGDLPAGVTAVGVPARPIKTHAGTGWDRASSGGAA